MDQNSQPEHSPENTTLAAQWERIPSLHLIAADAPGFAAVEQQVLEARARIEPLIVGAPDALCQEVRQSGAALRGSLQQEGSAPAAPEAAEKVYTQGEKRVIFLWATTYLLESLADELQNATLDSDARANTERQLRNALADTVRALSDEDGEEQDEDDCGCEDGVGVTCKTCRDNYLKCTLPPATCYANYQTCLSTCTGRCD